MSITTGTGGPEGQPQGFGYRPKESSSLPVPARREWTLAEHWQDLKIRTSERFSLSMIARNHADEGGYPDRNFGAGDRSLLQRQLDNNSALNGAILRASSLRVETPTALAVALTRATDTPILDNMPGVYYPLMAMVERIIERNLQ